MSVHFFEEKHPMNAKAIGVSVVLVLALLVGGQTSPAAAVLDATIQSITVNGCFIDVVFTVQDAGNYFVNWWDDGHFRAGAGGAVPANGTMTVRYVIGDPILEGAAGIGIYVENGIGLAATVTYDSNGSFAVPASVGDPCAAANDTTAYVLGTPGCDQYMAITSTSVGGAFVADAPVYSTPGTLVSPAVTISAGNTAWVLGKDASGQYYKIVWACDYLWVPVGTLGPNPDAVWNNAPLPTQVVQ